MELEPIFLLAFNAMPIQATLGYFIQIPMVILPIKDFGSSDDLLGYLSTYTKII